MSAIREGEAPGAKGDDVAKALIGWPRCPVCGEWMELIPTDHRYIWVCRDRHGDGSRVYYNLARGAGWERINGGAASEIDGPKVATSTAQAVAIYQLGLPPEAPTPGQAAEWVLSMPCPHPPDESGRLSEGHGLEECLHRVTPLCERSYWECGELVDESGDVPGWWLEHTTNLVLAARGSPRLQPNVALAYS